MFGNKGADRNPELLGYNSRSGGCRTAQFHFAPKIGKMGVAGSWGEGA
jgi:hypothetical protein